MELFSVKRYTGKKTDTVENENVIKDKLLKKIEQRKRKHKEISKEETTKQKKPLVENNLEDEPNEQLNEKETENDLKEEISIPEDDPITSKDEPEEITTAEVPFEVLGEDINKKKVQNAMMYHPPWITHPTIISTTIGEKTENNSVKNLKYLQPYVRQALKEMKIKQLFPVQEAVIPWILEAHSKPKPFRPRDICVSAPTGSGKTLAFAIPVVQLLANSVGTKIRALVVLPVAELAHQVFKVFQKLCQKTNLKVCLLSKKIPFSVEQEKLVEFYKGQAHSKVDIVITTPGRLVEHLFATKNLCFKSLKFLVIDEADRIMDAFFQNWLYHLDEKVRDTSKQLLAGNAGPLCYNELLATASTAPHKLLFSATMSDDPEKLQDMRLFQPKLFTSVIKLKAPQNLETNQEEEATEVKGEFIGQFTTPAELSEKYCITESRLKPLTLFTLIRDNNWKKFLCFTNSVDSAKRLAYVLDQLLLSMDIVVRELSGSLTPKMRANVLSQFARGKVHGLVCSDALARGIDVPDVDVVISYDPPRHIKTYIHRVGRTARAGRQGTAVLLVSEKEREMVNKILLDAGKVVNEEIKASDTTEIEKAAKYAKVLNKLRIKIQSEKQKVVVQKRLAHAKTVLLEKSDKPLSLVDKLKLQAINCEEKRAEISKTTAPKRFTTKGLRKFEKKLNQQDEK